MSPVKRDELKLLIVEAMPGQHLVGVWDRDPKEAIVVEFRLRAVGCDLIAVEPPAVQGIDASE